MNRKKFSPLLMSMFAVSLVTGCLPRDSIEDVSLIQIVGYDVAKDDEIRGTVVVPHFSRMEQGKGVEEETLTSTAHSTKQIHTKLQSKAARPITIGTLKVALYSAELAEKGIGSVIDSMARDPRIGRNIYLAITEGNTKEILDAGISKNETTGKFISGLIEQNAATNFPRTNLHEFLYTHFGKGMDGYLPYLKLNDRDELALDGIAFFNDGKFVYKAPYEKSYTFTLLKENFKEATQEIEFEKRYIVVESIGSNVKYIFNGDKDNPAFTIKITMTGIINDAPTLALELTPPVIKKMEKTIEKYNEKEAEEMIKKFQEHKIDPLGLGSIIDNRVRNLDFKKWKEEQYPEMPIKVDLKMKILEVGTTS
ncbi:Ger(x)C family spore germination protein [Pseudalkalibacillus sp. SCS-8]|uniref:Ger(x)C family spore germination protein n=1 Tax=Pseudalkalibacillus nanhaiensis TaxID=3115291 RepID=UPI0032DB3E1F